MGGPGRSAGAVPPSRDARDGGAAPPPSRSILALMASSRSSRSFFSFSLAASSRCTLERISTAWRADCSATYSASVILANWSLMATSCSSRGLVCQMRQLGILILPKGSAAQFSLQGT